MADPITAARLASTATLVTTIGTARAAIGACSKLLGEAYAKTEQADLWDEDELKESIRGRLNGVRRYGEVIYDAIGTDDPDLQGEEISTWNATRVGLLISQTNAACEDVDEAISENNFDVAATVAEGLRIAGETVGKGVQYITKSVAAGGAAFVAAAWPTLLLGAAAVGVFLWLKAGRPSLGGGS